MLATAQPGPAPSGYSPYNPAVVGKVLTIFRVFHNYWAGQRQEDYAGDAARALSKAPIDIEDILYFVP